MRRFRSTNAPTSGADEGLTDADMRGLYRPLERIGQRPRRRMNDDERPVANVAKALPEGVAESQKPGRAVPATAHSRSRISSAILVRLRRRSRPTDTGIRVA